MSKGISENTLELDGGNISNKIAVYCRVSSHEQKQKGDLERQKGRLLEYCHNPVMMYGFLIDEAGTIYKCGFGTWDYASIDECQHGGFDVRFKEFNKIFYSAWVANCARCIDMFNNKTK